MARGTEGTEELEAAAKELEASLVALSPPNHPSKAQLKKAEALAEKGQAIAQRTGQWLKKRLSDRNLDRGERAELESIGRRFEAAGRRFEEVSRKVLGICKQQAMAEAAAGEGGGGGGREDERVKAGQAMASLEEPLLDETHLQHSLEGVLEKNNELRQLESDLTDLHTLFKDVATLAQMQQESLDTIETAVMETGMRVVAGNQELQKASRTQKRARQRMCCMVVTGSIAVIVLVSWIIGPLTH
uniref:t-SNARE coiled-coil homology domain-containing protein n=1 Tax=Guillardia theta TaxID=55529 RepID=A0A7S4NDL8_GUITH|mmetsp:Transcript_20304/g.67771  ORF Transcript_20304/g.67771 Transcript_20304/m.67771 type:complete len:244 (+) Transcript_20304:35-766(+)